MPGLLEIDSVLKSFDDRQVLNDVYLKCQTGEIIGMLGRNGSGKSTLLQIIFGTLTAEKFVRIDGRVRERPYKMANEVCYLPQHDFLPKHMTVAKVVGLYLGQNKVDGFLNDDLLGSCKESRIYVLSGGESRYLEIKLLLSTQAKFVLLDEPFNGVAPVMVATLKELIRNGAQTKGIILTDHDYRNVLDVATRCCLIHNGCIRQVADKTDLVKWGYISEAKL